MPIETNHFFQYSVRQNRFERPASPRNANEARAAAEADRWVPKLNEQVELYDRVLAEVAAQKGGPLNQSREKDRVVLCSFPSEVLGRSVDATLVTHKELFGPKKERLWIDTPPGDTARFSARVDRSTDRLVPWAPQSTTHYTIHWNDCESSLSVYGGLGSGSVYLHNVPANSEIAPPRA